MTKAIMILVILASIGCANAPNAGYAYECDCYVEKYDAQISYSYEFCWDFGYKEDAYEPDHYQRLYEGYCMDSCADLAKSHDSQPLNYSAYPLKIEGEQERCDFYE